MDFIETLKTLKEELPKSYKLKYLKELNLLQEELLKKDKEIRALKKEKRELELKIEKLEGKKKSGLSYGFGDLKAKITMDMKF